MEQQTQSMDMKNIAENTLEAIMLSITIEMKDAWCHNLGRTCSDLVHCSVMVIMQTISTEGC